MLVLALGDGDSVGAGGEGVGAGAVVDAPTGVDVLTTIKVTGVTRINGLGVGVVRDAEVCCRKIKDKG